MALTRLREALIEELTKLDTLNYEAEVEIRLQYLNKISDNIVEYENYFAQNHFNSEIRMLCERGLQFIAVENTSLIK